MRANLAIHVFCIQVKFGNNCTGCRRWDPSNRLVCRGGRQGSDISGIYWRGSDYPGALVSAELL